jgi:hypothetical protein
MGMRLLEKKKAGLDSRKTWSDIVSLVESNVREYMAILHVNHSSKVLHGLVLLVCLLEREREGERERERERESTLPVLEKVLLFFVETCTGRPVTR